MARAAGDVMAHMAKRSHRRYGSHGWRQRESVVGLLNSSSTIQRKDGEAHVESAMARMAVAEPMRHGRHGSHGRCDMAVMAHMAVMDVMAHMAVARESDASRRHGSHGLHQNGRRIV